MNLEELERIYNFSGKLFVVTGGAGVLGGEIVAALAGLGAGVVILDIKPELSDELQTKLKNVSGEVTISYADVLSPDSLKEAEERILHEFGRVDGLINAAGGNNPKATATKELPFFDISRESFAAVADLNLLGTVLPCQIFGKIMAARNEGAILNISSMAAIRPLTKVTAYSAAKAGISNFTQWLAVYLAGEISPQLRVNAIAPGFFITRQNRYLLLDEKTGEYTGRGQAVIDHTPMARFGQPQDLIGIALWLLSDASKFVTGIVVPVDGGFSAFSGV